LIRGIGELRSIIASLLAIVMPGAGQIYNGQILKGFMFLLLEHAVNSLAHLNQGVYMDFNGLHNEALQVINYQFALFYPGVYSIGIYDAFQSSKQHHPHYNAAIFFIIAGMLGTFSIIYAKHLPYPLLFGGTSILAPILLGVILHRK
jgi:hypothetical protein